MKSMMSQEEAKRQLNNLFGASTSLKKEDSEAPSKDAQKTQARVKVSKELEEASGKRRRIVVQEKKTQDPTIQTKESSEMDYNKKTKGVPVPKKLAADLKKVVDAGFFSTRELGLKVGYSNTTAAPRVSEIVRGKQINVTRKRLLKLEALAKTYLNKMKVLEQQAVTSNGSAADSVADVTQVGNRTIDVEVENKLATNVPMFSDDQVPTGLFAENDSEEELDSTGLANHPKKDATSLPERRLTIRTDAEIREVAKALKQCGIRARLEIDIDDWS